MIHLNLSPKTLLANTKNSRIRLFRLGYTMVIVMMLMVVLSGLAILTLNSVNVGSRETNLQKLNVEAFDTSSSAVTLFSEYAGTSAPVLVRRFSSDFNQNSARSQTRLQSNWAMLLSQDDVDKMIYGSASSGNKSPFAETKNNQTWERNRAVQFNIVVRDFADGMTAPGYSGNFCFKRVLLGGEATVGLSSTDKSNGTTYANSVTAQETLIGPIRCNGG